MNDPIQALITLVIFIFSAVVHEVSHGLVAEKMGDDTARRAGRITLNPLPHIDPFGSILLPGLLLLTGSPIVLGAAKPVPVRFDFLKPRRLGMALVSLAGPLSNLVLAILLVIPIKLGLVNFISGPILMQAVIINIVLAIFNILPIPPLDGSKLVAAFLPYRIMNRVLQMERFGFIVIIILLFTGLLDTIFVPVFSGFMKIFGLS
ncbi:MAG: site-2 protease family protein [Candidatus Doudnabacteria bacterium]